MTVKSASVADIQNHQITFKPASDRFNQITTADSTISYIEITSFGSVVRGIVVNAALVSAIVIVVAIVVVDFFVSIFTGGTPILSGSGSGTGLFNLPWDDFHKHIRVKNNKGIRKWDIKTVVN